ncbi:sensor histidine kinase [Phenylobacterium sp.]|uniref:sensor histidine kinase n=1 Tax=Phenylobacterium sp. TaxID=1871053 RepID=UPI002725DD64|nr:sensor histidine kinase [Phenylobacterium sp.]MDO8378896.1 sensor histidine kinase [Phenylobacterium sp.]
MQVDLSHFRGLSAASGGPLSPTLGEAPMPIPEIASVCADCSLLVEADHRIANHLAMLSSYVRLKAAGLAADLETRLLLENIGAQVDAVGRLHRALATHGNLGSVDLSEHLRAICAPFASGLAGAAKLIQDIPAPCYVRADQVLPLSQIVSEVITNAFKYAHADGQAGVVLVRCHLGEGGAVQIEVVDDGPGLPAGFDPATDGGLGFRLIRALSRQVRASTVFESAGKGLRFRLALP